MKTMKETCIRVVNIYDGRTGGSGRGWVGDEAKSCVMMLYGFFFAMNKDNKKKTFLTLHFQFYESVSQGCGIV